VRRKARKPSPEWSPVGAFVEASLKKLGVSHEVHKNSLEDWCRRKLGEGGAKALVRVTLRRGVVTFEMNHPAWMQELSGRQREMLKNIQGAFPDLAVHEMKVALARRGLPSSGA
jgi:hypothetical protein